MHKVSVLACRPVKQCLEQNPDIGSGSCTTGGGRGGVEDVVYIGPLDLTGRSLLQTQQTNTGSSRR